MTTVYFIKLILVVCVAFISNKNLQKSHIYKMSHCCIQCICVALDLFLKQDVLSPFITCFFFFFAHQTLIAQCNLLKRSTFSSNIFSFLKYTTYITHIFFYFKNSIVGCTMYLQPLCWHQISKDTLHSQNAKREECSFNMYTLHTFIYR